MREVVLDIVQRYVDPKPRRAGAGNVTCRCPFHKGGMEKSPSFSVNVELGLFHCFTCHVSGTIPTMLSMMGVPPSTIEQEVGPLREVIKQNVANRNIARKAKYQTSNPFRAQQILSEALVAAFNWCPTSLIELGFDTRWLQYLQVGVDNRNRRITYPVRDIYGNLAGFVGGRTDATQEPKYMVYKGRRTAWDGTIVRSEFGTWFEEEYPEYDFRNHDYLWNYDKVYPRLFFGREVETLVVVEGFKACIWSLQCGYRNTVALMGSSMSERQRELLLRVNANIVLFLDNNEAGWEGTHKIGNILQKAVPTVWVARYPNGASQPDDLDQSSVWSAIGTSIPFRNWKRERNLL